MRSQAIQALLLLLLLAVSATAAFAANDPGHDTLYVLRIGDTNVTGSINISGNVTAQLVRVSSRFFGDNLDIRADGSASTAQNFIKATATDLEIGSGSKIILNGGGTAVQVGTVAAPAILNVTGSIYQGNVKVCLANGTNCLTGNNSGNGTVTSVGLSLPAQFTVTGSPVTSSGTLTASWASAAQNAVFAGPSGSSGTPAFRALVDSDIPDAHTVSGGTIGSNTISSASTWTTSGTLTIGDNGDVVAISASNWDVDASGNIATAGKITGVGSGLREADTNILDTSTWVIGTNGTQTGFSANGNANENSIQLGTGPYGEDVPLWVGGSDAGSDADGGWNTAVFTVDPNKGYRYTVWIKKTGSTDGGTYLGLQGTVKTLAGAENGNPYFWSGDLPQLDKWYLIVGYLHPWNTTRVASIGGIYDAETGKKVVSITDFKHNDSTDTTQIHRSYLYYDTTLTDFQYFYAPRVDQLDGKEPSLDSLLSTSPLGINGTANYVPKFTTSKTIENSQIYDSGTNVGIGTAGPIQKLDVVGSINASGAGAKVYTPELCLAGNCQTTWPTGGGGNITGSGTANYAVKWANSTNLGNSIIQDTGTNVGIGVNPTNAKLEVVAASGEVFRADASGGAYRIVANQNYVLLNGNVGIGTVTPTKKLTVTMGSNGDAIAVNGVQSPGFLWNTSSTHVDAKNWGMYSNYNTYGDLAFLRSSNYSTDPYSGTISMVIKGDGNVGIGTIPATNMRLDVAGGGALLGGQIYVSPTNANTLNSGYGVNGLADMWINYRGYADGQTQYRNFNVGDGRGANVAWFDGTNKRMSINNGQAADYTLHVVGTTSTTKLLFGAGDRDLETTTSGGVSIFSNEINAGAQGGTGNLYLGYRRTSNTYIQAQGGNVAIGGTTVTSKLDVSGGDIQVENGQGRFKGWYNAGSGLAAEIGISNNQGYVLAYDRTGSTYYPLNLQAGSASITLNSSSNAIYINPSGGNTGIGTTAPGYKFVVQQTAANGVDVYGGGHTGRYIAAIGDIGTKNLYIGIDNTANLVWFGHHSASGGYAWISHDGSAWAERMRIHTNGNVGIGTTGPNTKLEVAGSYNADPIRTSASGHSAGIGVDGSGTYWGTGIFQDGTKRLTIDSTGGVGIGANYVNADLPSNGLAVEGNIGIGTSSPVSGSKVNIVTGSNAGLVVADAAAVGGDCETYNTCIRLTGATHSQIKLEGRASSGVLRMYFDSSVNPPAGLYTASNHKLGFGANNNRDHLIIDTNGNIGMGISSPAAKLDVQGKAMMNNYTVQAAGADNMLVNGDFEMGNIGWTAQGNAPTVVTGGYSGKYAGQFTGSLSLINDDLIPVDPTRDVIQLEGYFKKTTTGSPTPGILYFGYIAYDASLNVLTAAPCGYYCYFAASGYTIPNDGAWHKFSATSTGEGTGYPNFPVGTKYVRVLALVNYAASGNEVTQFDHITVRRLNYGPAFIGQNYDSTNLADNQQVTKLYTRNTNHFIIEAPSVTKIGTGTPSVVSTAGTLYVTSHIETDGNFYGSGADLAEKINASNATGPIDAGSVVIADPTAPEQIILATTPYDTAVVGVVSTDPSIILSKSEGDVPLALSGRVPLKVSAENGPIKPGDLLTTSSTPGHAMRCESREACQGAIVAKSLGFLESGTGSLTAMVMLG